MADTAEGGFGVISLDCQHQDKPCHDLLYISGAFRRLYPVGTNAKSMSCWTENARRAERLRAWGR